MTLTEFLLARIAEDERAAQAARDRIFPTTWREDVEKMRNPHVVDFVARQKPERVLAECEAKREVIRWFHVSEDPSMDSMPWQIMKRVLGALALPYIDHADFNPVWRP